MPGPTPGEHLIGLADLLELDGGHRVGEVLVHVRAVRGQEPHGAVERVREVVVVERLPGPGLRAGAFAPLPHLHARMRYYGGMRFDMQAETGAEWRVRPRLGGCPMPVSLPFIILQADPTSHMCVGYPDRSYLWIMSRRPKIEEELYTGLVKQSVEEWGYEAEKIQRVRQFWDENDYPKSPTVVD